MSNIRIVEFLPDECTSSGNGSLAWMAFRLSETPPAFWLAQFAQEWERAFYSMKRDVSLNQDRLRIESTPVEVETHLPHLKEAIRRTNEAFAEMKAASDAHYEAMQKAEQAKTKALADLKVRLKFDD